MSYFRFPSLRENRSTLPSANSASTDGHGRRPASGDGRVHSLRRALGPASHSGSITVAALQGDSSEAQRRGVLSEGGPGLALAPSADARSLASWSSTHQPTHRHIDETSV